jgi:hypothetical protein
VTRPGPLRRWDPLRPVATGAATAYRAVFVTMRRLVAGRRLTVGLDDGELRFTVTEFDSRLDLRALSAGQLGEVRVAARDVRWQDSRFDRVSAVLHNVYLRPAAPPVVVAAPVDLTVDVSADALDDLLAWTAPRLAGEVGDDGVARLRWARRPGAGHIEIDARLDGSTLCLQPRAVTMRRARWALPGRTPAYRVALPELPHGLRLTGVELAPGALRLTATLPQWEFDVPTWPL